MGKPNVVTKRYMQDNTRFADICNFFLYNGQQIIKPENLIEKDITELALPKEFENVKTVEKFRDVLRGCCVKTAGGITYLVVGIENQSDIHYAMVVRNMLYDALNYSAQVETYARQHRKKKDVSGAEFLSGFAKDDKLVPVITLTIYWNTGSWDGARSLHEMMDVSDKSILNYVTDYKLNLIVPEEIEDFAKFNTELGPLLEFINASANGKKFINALRQKGARWENLSEEAINLLNICLDTKFKVKNDLREGAGSMCKGIEEALEIMRAEGRTEGKLVTLLQLVQDGLLELSIGAERAGISIEEFRNALNQL